MSIKILAQVLLFIGVIGTLYCLVKLNNEIYHEENTAKLDRWLKIFCIINMVSAVLHYGINK